MDSDQDVIIVGAGMSGIGMAVQLIRKFNLKNFTIIERTNDVGGTWFVNSYPGCGCDVPSHFYSYSFAPNPNWTQKFALQPEIHEYFKDVARQYSLLDHVRFRSVVEKAEWDGMTATWMVTIANAEGNTYMMRSKFLVSAVGGLSIPKKCDIPGAENFKGALFHSAQWDHTVDLKGKDVVTIGNGCSATQFVPVISTGPEKVKRVTQFSRQAHWLSERPNPMYSESFKTIMRYVPGAMFLYRAYLYWLQELDFLGFHIEKGSKIREEWTRISKEYILKNAPKKFAHALVPKTVIGCKRRVMDTDYLACLHRNNVELVSDDPTQEITEHGVVTKSGRFVHADVITLANGFETQKMLFPMEIRGEDGVTVAEHWDRFSAGVPQAYHGTCISGFPNFFVLMGPNTLSGHLSVIYTTECEIGLIMRLMAPIIKSSFLSRLTLRQRLVAVAIQADAEQSYNKWLQAKAKQLVWASGCTSWFLDPISGRNTVMFPDWQFIYWWKCIMIQWKDFRYLEAKPSQKTRVGRSTPWFFIAALALPVATSLLCIPNNSVQNFRESVVGYLHTA